MTDKDPTPSSKPLEISAQETNADSIDTNERVEFGDDHLPTVAGLGDSALRLIVENPQEGGETDYHKVFPGLKNFDPSIIEGIAQSQHKKDSISKYFEQNPDADRSAIALRWLGGEKYEVAAVADRLSQFPDINRKYVATKLAENQLSYMIVDHLGEFPDIDKGDLIEQLFEQGHESSILQNMDSFPDLNREEFVDKVLKEGRDSFALLEILNHLDEFPAADRDLLATRLIRQNMDFQIALNIRKFPNVDRKELASHLFALNQETFILESYEEFVPYLSMRQRYKLARKRQK